MLLCAPTGIAQEILPSNGAPSADAFREKVLEARALREEAGADAAGLESAVTAFREADGLMPEDLPIVEREHFLGDFAEALSALGLASFNEAPIIEAVGLLHGQLGEERRARDPEGWADTQIALGNTYWGWAAWDNNIERAQLALEAFDAALTVRTRTRDPLGWANIQNSIGAVYTLIGAAEEGTAALEQAIAAYEAALTVLTREAYPADWAAATGNLAGALGFLARRTGEPDTYRNALALMQEAHEAIPRDEDPGAWATSLVDIAQTAAGLAEMTGEVEPLRVAADAYDEALTALSFERDGALRAQALNNNGLVLITLGQATGDVSVFDKAVAVLRESLLFWTRESDPDSFSTISWLIGDAALAGGRLANDPERLQAAAAAYEDAQSITPHDDTGTWTYLGYLHATALTEAALAEGDAADLPAARDELAAVFEEFVSMSMLGPAAIVAQQLCTTSASLGELTGEREAFNAAATDCREAEERLLREGSPRDAAEAGRRREAAEAALAALE